jgi:cytidylate kinase
MQSLIVAIDGPSGVGKTTASRLVARALALPHIDTGAMYRAIAVAAERAGIDVHDAERLAALSRDVAIEFVPGSDRGRVMLDDADVTDLIRTPAMSMAASHVSAVPAVRRSLVQLQQELGRRKGGVLEGRDIGTKVFPETPFKFFLTATPEVRAQRRYRELLAKGTDTSFSDVLADTIQRDTQDSTRADSPLTFDDSYHVIDTSALTIDEVVATIVATVRAA